MPGIGIGIGPWRKRRSSAAAPALAIGDTWGVIGDSMSYGDRRPKMYAYWLTLAMDGRLRWKPTTSVGTDSCQGSNLGVSGQTTTQIAARAAGITASALDAVFLLAFENDGTGVTLATMQANYRSIIAAAISGGAKRVYVIGPGETKTVFANSTLATRNGQLDDWIESGVAGEYPEAYGIPAATAWADITLHNGAGGAGPDSFDGIHPNIQGAKKLAENIWGAMGSQVAAGDAYSANPYATNLFPADFSGTGGSISNGTGQVATGLALTNTTGATMVAAKGTLDGMPSQIITLSGTATANARVQLREVITHTFVATDSFDGWGRIKVSNAAQSGPPVGLRALGIELQGGRHTFFSQYHVDTTEGAWTSMFDGTFRVQPDYPSAGGSSFNTDVNIQTIITSGIDIRVEVADMQVFNLVQEGF